MKEKRPEIKLLPALKKRYDKHRYKDMQKIVLSGNALDELKKLDSESVDCCVTSPPYYKLRKYEIPDIFFEPFSFTMFGFQIDIPAWRGQYGDEPTVMMYIGHTVEIFREVRRVLKKDGTLWLNIGDTYASHAAQVHKHTNLRQKKIVSNIRVKFDAGHKIKPKDLFGIPATVALALREDGWYYRQDIIWHKTNAMPSSQNDRCTSAHEYLFLFSKSRRYYYDAKSIATPIKDKTLTTYGIPRTGYGDGSGDVKSENMVGIVRTGKVWKAPDGWDTGPGAHGSIHKDGRSKGKPYKPKEFGNKDHSGYFDKNGNLIGDGLANKKSVWPIATKRYPEAHFATFPDELIIDCIKAGCRPEGTVLDPFGGSGTTGRVSERLGRNSILIELGRTYLKMIDKGYDEIGRLF